MPSPAVEAAGVAEVLALPSASQVRLANAAIRGELRLAQLLGTTNYAALLADTLSLVNQRAALHAGKILGAADYYSWRVPAVSDRGVSLSVVRQDAGTETFMSGPEVAKAARDLRDQAIEVLKEAGLYQEPVVANFTKVGIDEDETD
mgnify:FL=1